MTQADTLLREPADLGEQQGTPARRRLIDRRWQGVVAIAIFLLIWQVISELKLVYNKTRQAAITKELSEIVGGAAAV